MKKKKVKDRHLDTPSEANRDKHINFLALEENDIDPSDAPSGGYLDPSKNPKKVSDKHPRDREDGGKEQH